MKAISLKIRNKDLESYILLMDGGKEISKKTNWTVMEYGIQTGKIKSQSRDYGEMVSYYRTEERIY
jgi:hypothetical protein